MRKNILFILLATISLMGCKPSGQHVSAPEGIALAGHNDTVLMDVKKKYTAIEAEAAVNVVYSDSVKCLLVITDAAVMPYVSARVERGTLHLGYKKNVAIGGEGYGGVTIWVPYDAKVKEISLSGASTLLSKRPLVGSHFEMELSGGSSANCYFDMPDGDLELDVSGASCLRAGGCVRRLDADISGASRSLSEEKQGQYTFTAGLVHLDVSGASLLQVHSNGTIDGDISGASLLSYTGQAKVSKIDCSGVSKVELRQDPLLSPGK